MKWVYFEHKWRHASTWQDATNAQNWLPGGKAALESLWEEYREANPDGYGYSRFCELYQRWRKKLDVVMRQEDKAGEDRKCPGESPKDRAGPGKYHGLAGEHTKPGK